MELTNKSVLIDREDVSESKEMVESFLIKLKPYTLQQYLDKKYTKKERLNLKNLKTLNCSHENITSLEGIENLTLLEELFCYNNQITNLIGIENLTFLKVLSCDNNQITSLIGIENLTYLKELYCGNNQLTSLKGIENLTYLEYLHCSNNPLPYKHRNIQDVLKEIKIEKRKNIISKLYE